MSTLVRPRGAPCLDQARVTEALRVGFDGDRLVLTLATVRANVLGSRPRPEWTLLRDCLARDPEVLAILRAAPAQCVAQGQLMNMVARITAFLDEGCRSPNAMPGMTRSDDYARVRGVLLRQASTVRALLRMPNQTNNPLRAAALYPAFCLAGAWARRPLALVEIGPSIGLNLCWDKYGLEYPGIGRYGDRRSKCQLTYTLRAVTPDDRAQLQRILVRGPRIGSRIGLERSPVQPASTAEQLWLSGGGTIKDHATAITRQLQPRIVAGDAVKTLPAVLAQIDRAHTPCVFSSFVTYQMGARARRTLESHIAAVGRRRPIARIALGEWPNKRGARLDLTCLAPGAETHQILGFCDMDGDCGAGMDWVGG